MQGQQSLSATKLKRQLSFLKGIDQKLEGLRRENERLRRIVSNPRVRFSRSSLGGLYRIVNSMMSAGPMYNLETIEQWAQKTRDWLVELGKRGSGPSNDELDWLVETISELGELRDAAQSATVAALKPAKVHLPDSDKPDADASGDADANPDADDSGEPDYDKLPDVLKDYSPSREPDAEPPIWGSEEPAGFPFTDEPQERSISPADFWQEGNGRPPADHGFRDRTSTIPLAIDDLTSVNPPMLMPPKVPPPVPTSGSPGLWKPFAIVSFMGFMLTTALFIWARGEAEKAKAALAAAPTAPAAPAVAPTPVLPSATTDTAPPTADNADSEAKGDDENAATQKDKAEGKAPDTPKADENSAKAKPPTKKSPPPAKVEKKKKKKKKPKEKAPAKTPVENKIVGTLSIKAPDSGGSVLVLVDGMSRGKAPVRVTLSPGLHEVVFMKDGKKSIRMVPIRPDATKTISAIVP